MEAILTRTGEPAATPSRRRPVKKPPELRELLAAVAQSLAERVPLPHRELSPEWFRFPLP
jgi:hypothetical protein